MPGNIRNEIGHFNVFPLGPFVGEEAKSIPYKRRDFYKVMLVLGGGEVHYADRVINVPMQALSFSNPQIPYKWAKRDLINGGFFCIFNQHFFNQFGDLNQYSVFQPAGQHIFELSNEQVLRIRSIYERMFEEIGSSYIHKYDVLRNLVFELLHIAMKMQPSAQLDRQDINASQRITTLFMELLEQQFPIEENHPRVQFRTASDFAQQLNIHVNHLNRSVKETMGKTTSQLIAERILQEARILLKHSQWSISEIAFALGFSEATHFSNFFKKHAQMSPTSFRSI
ncbi:MAG: helix-turn-helix transcriptional regulator [Saprospiraceae bacterium]